jgi:hypothetical protein
MPHGVSDYFNKLTAGFGLRYASIYPDMCPVRFGYGPKRLTCVAGRLCHN